MSEARDLYTRISSEYQIWRIGNRQALRPLLQAAELWRKERRFFSAAICMIDAVQAAWGTNEIHECLNQVLIDFQASVDSEPPYSLEALAALHTWLLQLHYVDIEQRSRPASLLQQELAERLLRYYGDSEERDSYLVRGFVLSTDLDGNWKPTFPSFEVYGGARTKCGADLIMSMPSAFRLFVRVGDYGGAQDIVNRCESAFTTPGLKGWKLAVEGFLNPEKQVEFFSAAADHFAKDEPPEKLEQGRSWDSSNIELWAKYFRARAAVGRILTEPTRVVALLQEALEHLAGTESGWVDSQVNRFRLLTSTLLEALQQADMDVDRILRQLRGDQWLSITSHDPVIEEFVRSAAAALQSFRINPARAVLENRLSPPLELLARIPLFGPDLTSAIAPSIAETALFGPQKTWIYRTLEAITIEAHLHEIILRLEQAQHPLLAQIRQGPLEYGKDIVAVFERDGKRIVRMWQAKIGDMNVPKFRVARQELEEMYLVPLPALQVPGQIDQSEGILIFNGHANANAEPVMQGWLDEQTQKGRRFRFMHLDDFVNWIVDNKLIMELRKVLADLKIQPIV